MMKKLLVIAAFLLASSAAQAQYTFEYGGRTIRVDPDRGTVSIPGVYDNTGRRNKRWRDDQDADHMRKQAPAQAKVDPQAPAEPPEQTEQAPVNAAPAPATATLAPTNTQPSATPSADTAAQVQQAPASAAVPAPAPVVATAPVPAPVQNQQATASTAPAASSATTPLGVWLTEEKEGKVRIEQCGANLCGYSVDAKSNQNREQVLINMKPGKSSKWSGQIFDPNSGSTYDSTIALNGSNTLRVQGCAFGGMFCGGQTWSRLN
jgi:uncharacterized protein (DUF2147 family)